MYIFVHCNIPLFVHSYCIINNVKSTFYDPNDYPNIMVNRQCDDRALSEYKKNKEDKQTQEEIEALDEFLKRKNKTKARRLFR